MRTSRAAALIAATVVTAGVAVGYAVHSRHPTAASTPAAATAGKGVRGVSSTPQAQPRQPVLAALSSTAPEPTEAGVTAELAKAAKTVAGGARLVGEVTDADSGAVLWSRQSTRAEPPASTAKLLTAAAALTALGPSAHLTTSTKRLGKTVYLVGGGDPTIVASSSSYVSPSYPRPATLAALAKATASALGSIHRVRLRLDVSAWSGPTAARGWKPSYVTEGDVTPPSALELDEGRVTPTDEFAARTPTPAAQAGDAFADLLAADGVTVTGDPRLAATPSTAVPLASVSSPTIAALVQRMLTVSDDDLAEALGRAVASHDDLPATFTGAAAAVVKTIASLGIPTTGVSLYDTSGLSHLDRIPPATLVAVLRAATSSAHPGLRSLLAGLPVAGLTGTLATRYLTHPSAAAAGVLRAKTGTLTGVNTLSGTVVDDSGRLLLFAFMASDARLPGLTVPQIDVLASKLAHCGC